MATTAVSALSGTYYDAKTRLEGLRSLGVSEEYLRPLESDIKKLNEDKSKAEEQVKLITRSRTSLDKESENATKRIALVDKECVKVDNIVHSRLFIVGTRESIISSADLKSDSVDTNFEAGVWTNNPIIVNDAIQFFNKIWEEARAWSR